MGVGSAETATYRPFHKAMRSGVIGPATRGLLGTLAFFFATRTDKYFAWTIEPPLSAAILGANYWASTVLAILASRESLWANGRISISVAVIFSPLMTAATFIHLGQFHTDASGITLVIAWFWIVAYGLYPIQLGLQIRQQLRTPGIDPPRTVPLARWVKWVLTGHAVVLIPMGILMFATPGLARPWFPWDLAALSSRALAAWTLAFGVLAAHAILEDDVNRVKVALWGYPLLGVLHLVALARFGDAVQWGEPGAWVYLAFLASTFVLGAYGFAATRGLGEARPRPASAPAG